MDREKFQALLPVISTDLAQMVARRRGVSELEAIKLLYASKLYAELEREETKLWHCSTHMLHALLEQEWKTGEFEYPDV